MNRNEIKSLVSDLNTRITTIIRIINLVLVKSKITNVTLSKKDIYLTLSDTNQITLNLPKHWIYIDSGRKAGTYPTRKAIYDWLLTKKIVRDTKEAESLSYAIQRSIFTKGIKARPFLEEVRLEIMKYLRTYIDELLASKINRLR